MAQKQYGLILPDKNKSKNQAQAQSKPKNVFGDDSSEEEESNVDWTKQALKKQSHSSMQQKASMKVMKNALEQDPNCYQYDEVFDDMVKRKEEAIAKKKGDKKAKYIDVLIKTAKHRELENDLRKEREAQKEREKEGDMFADKEAFVTSGFKKKMEELRKMQEDQAYNDAIDDVTDVTKQNDISGFYRQLYKDTMKDMPNETPKEQDKPSSSEENPEEKACSPSKDVAVAISPDRTKRESVSPIPRSRSPERKLKDRDEDNKLQDSRHRRRSGSREGRRRYDSPPSSRSRHREHNRDRSRDRHERRHQGRQRRSRSHSRGRVRDHDNTRHRSRSPREERSRDHDRHRRDDKDKPRRSDNKEKERHRRPSEIAAEEEAKIKIIQKENWYDFDVEIERNVKKDFYAKRTVGKAFEEALQRYILRKGTTQIVTYK